MSTKQQLIKRSDEECRVLTICLACAVGVAPFTILRFMNAQWLAGTIDTLLVTAMIAIGLYVWITRLTRAASVILALSCASAMVLVVYINGPTTGYWAFPTMVATYFLVKPKEAALINTIAAPLLILDLLPKIEAFAFSSFLTTLIMSNLLAYFFSSQIKKQHEELSRLAAIDPLTNINNRRVFVERIRESVAMRKRHHEINSLITIDIDFFKKVNDTFGHAKGDEVLVNLANLLRARLREGDSAFRIGGEEFAVLLQSTNATDAMNLAEELRAQVENYALLAEYPLTISLGVAECTENDSEATWLKRTDAALYQAKNTGRNRICQAQP